MSEQFIDDVVLYINNVICGFESGMYKMVSQTNKDKLEYLSHKHQPFITIYRDLHEDYFTRTFNSIVREDDINVVNKFNSLQEMSGHSKQCILEILANVIISIHFNLDRKKLNIKTHDIYIRSIELEIKNILLNIDIKNFFSHDCKGPTNLELKVLPDGKKFIEIKLSHVSNDVVKPINSHTNKI